MTDYTNKKYAWMKLDKFVNFVRDNNDNDSLNDFVNGTLQQIALIFQLPSKKICMLSDVAKFLETQIGLNYEHHYKEQKLLIELNYITHEISVTFQKQFTRKALSRKNFYEFAFHLAQLSTIQPIKKTKQN